MTDQELYTKVRTHLLTQMKKSEMVHPELGNQCKYRTPDGLKCAIGCLIPDEKYHRALEGLAVGDLGVQVAADLQPIQRDLSQHLQMIHDVYRPAEWREELDKIALQYRFTVEV